MDFFDIYQQHQIRGQARDLRQTEENVSRNRRHTNDQVGGAEERIDQLLLLCEAMWELITETTSLTTEDLAAKAYELDMSDGNKDGRRQRMAATCHCGAKVNPKASICQFCSSPAPERSAFEAV